MDKSSKDPFEVFSEDFALFIEAGFIAAKQFDEVSSRRIFEAAQILRPESNVPRIGLGNIALNKLDLKEAAAIFGKLHAEDPENDLVHTYLGISYILSDNKRKDGEAILTAIHEKTSDPIAKELSKSVLESIKLDLAKKASKSRLY